MANYDRARLDALSDIGEDGSNFDKNLTGMEKAGGDFLKRVANNIESKSLVDSGSLLKSLAIEKVDNFTLDIKGNGYIKYLDLGIKGTLSSSKAPNSPYQMTKMPPVETFVDWIKSKNLRLRNNEAYGGNSDEMVDDTRVRQVAYAMAKKRMEEGYEPQEIFSKEIPRLIDEASTGVVNKLIANFFEGLDNNSEN